MDLKKILFGAKSKTGLDQLLTLKEVCDLLKVHANTLRQWDKKGILVAVRIGEKRIRRYRKEDIEKFLQDGAPGVFGRKFTVHPSALDFTDLSSPGDQKGYPKAAPFRPAKSRLLAHV